MLKENKQVSVIRDIRDRDGLVASALDQRPRGRGFESAVVWQPWAAVALCTLGLGLLNPPSSRGR